MLLHGCHRARVHQDLPHSAGLAVQQFLRTAPAQQPPAGEDRDVPGDRLDVGDDMGGQQHHPVLGEGAQQIAEAHPFLRIEAGGGFVDDDDARVPEQRLGDTDPAQHAARVRAERPPHRLGQVDQREQFVDPGPGGPGGKPLGGREVGQELARGEVRVDAEVLREEAEFPPEQIGVGEHVGPPVGEPSGGGPGHGGDDPHQRGLARAVRSEQAEQPGAESQREAVDRVLAAPVDLADVGQFEVGCDIGSAHAPVLRSPGRGWDGD